MNEEPWAPDYVALLDELLAEAPASFAMWRGPEHVFVLTNPAYERMVGKSGLIGKTVREAFPELAGTGIFERLDRAYRGEAQRVRELAARLDRPASGLPEEGVFSFSLSPIRDREGRAWGVLQSSLEITEVVQAKRRAEELVTELRASEARYRELITTMDEGFCVLEMLLDEEDRCVDFRVVETNEAFTDQTGLLDAVGRTAHELIPGLEEEPWFSRFEGVARTGEPARFEERLGALGRTFDLYATRAGAPDSKQIALVFKDVSARREAEQKRERLLSRESAAREDAEEANRLKDEFLSMVSHELRTPLTAMLGWVQMMRAGTLPADKFGQGLEIIERNARTQAQLIGDLLDVSRILSGKLRLELEPVDLQGAVAQGLESVRPAANAKGIELEAALEPVATLPGDAVRLQQVIWNLLSNAVKFTPRGGRVSVFVRQGDGSLELGVEDTGQGIAPELLPHVFERFRQGERGTIKQRSGLGLGLSIVKHLVEAHGGSVEAQSEGVGKGASFVVRLPWQPEPGRGRDAPSRTPRSEEEAGATELECPPSLEGLRVLVVDDEADTRALLAVLLEGCEAEVHVAATADEGLRKFLDERPDLLISDIGMPGEDGYSFIRRIRALPPQRGGRVPAIALTAYARREDRTRVLLAGFTSHVPKPVEPMELIAVIASLVERG